MMVSFFFLLLGVEVLVGAYRINDPFAFMLTFFASNFIILISATLLIGFAIRLWRCGKVNNGGPEEEELPP